MTNGKELSYPNTEGKYYIHRISEEAVIKLRGPRRLILVFVGCNILRLRRERYKIKKVQNKVGPFAVSLLNSHITKI